MAKKQVRTRVYTVICRKCDLEMYSRARHDFHGCKCGTFVDGGFDYLRYGWPGGTEKPTGKTRYVNATRQELYDDWNKQNNKYGFILKRGEKCPQILRS
jgi:hypothetical protein